MGRLEAAGGTDLARRRFRDALPRSVAHYEKARQVVPRGTARSRFWWPLPTYVERAEGAYLYDLDGRRLIDCTLGFGPLILGHGHPEVISAIERQLRRGLLFGAASEEEYELARTIADHVVNTDWVLFLNSGTEATLGAFRVARAATGREKVAKFEGGWHGWHDFVMHSFGTVGGEPSEAETIPDSKGVSRAAAEQVVTLPFNHPAAIDRIRREAADLACVIVEGVQGGGGVLAADPQFVRDLRRVCDENGILLIFDEVITGFRLGPGGAAGMLGVEPDITTLGKVIGGGLAVGAICGSASLREFVERGTVMAGTFSSNPLTMVAGSAQLQVLLRDGRAYEDLQAMGDRMRRGLVSALDEVQVPAQVTSVASMWSLHFTTEVPRSRRDTLDEDHEAAKVLPSYLLREGVLLPAPMHLAFLSTAHDEEVVDAVVEAHVRALTAMREDGFLHG